MVEGSPESDKTAIAPELIGAEVVTHTPAEGTTTVVHPDTDEHVVVDSAAWLAAHAPDSGDFFTGEAQQPAPEAATQDISAEVEERLSANANLAAVSPRTAEERLRPGQDAIYTHPNGKQERIRVIPSERKGAWGDVDPRSGTVEYDAVSLDRDKMHFRLNPASVTFDASAEPQPGPEAVASEPLAPQATEVVAEIPNDDTTTVSEVPQETPTERAVAGPEIKKTGKAIWHGPEGDQMINVVGTMGEWSTSDGPKEYYKIAGSDQGIRAEQIEFIHEDPGRAGASPEPAVPTEAAAQEDAGSKEVPENPVTPEANGPDLEKIRDLNIDPRLILKLKENLAQKLQGVNNPDESFKKVQAIRMVTRHLLAQGLPVAENGDFEPEGMELLLAMTNMMELPNWALERLNSSKVAGSEPVVLEPDNQPAKDFVAKMNQGNRDKVDGKAKQWAPQKVELPPTKAEIWANEQLERSKQFINKKWYLRVPARAANYVYMSGKYAFGEIDKTTDNFMNFLQNGTLAEKRRSALGWIMGGFAVKELKPEDVTPEDLWDWWHSN